MNEKLRLFFTVGKVPTTEERAAASALNMTCFRNASRVGCSTLEPANEVAGAVPERYRALKGCRVVASMPSFDEVKAQAQAEADAKAHAEVKAQAEADALKAKQHRR